MTMVDPADAPTVPAAVLNSLIGREGEVAALVALVADPSARLVTLTGPGGVGKTRLALRVVDELREAAARSGADRREAIFVPLAAITDPALVPSAIAAALGVRIAGDRAVVPRLVAVIGGRRLLLVLDNFEQVVEAAPIVTDLLAVCPGVSILVTSRETLRVAGEHLMPVEPLLLPASDGANDLACAGASAAVRLFVARAAALRSGFVLDQTNAATISAICCRLDGLPLAIELAAAWIVLLPPATLLAQLAQRLAVLTGGRRDAPARQQTMRDAIAWSHDLLTPSEQRGFRRLAVFVGGFDLEAAEAVDGDPREPSSSALGSGEWDLNTLDLIASLVAKNLMRAGVGVNGGMRVGMLETIREFGLERLAASGEEEPIRQRHVAWAMAVAEASVGTLRQATPSGRLNRIGEEHDNLRAALRWCATAHQPEHLLRLAAALGEFWGLRDHPIEGLAWLSRALAEADPAPSLARADAAFHAGQMAHYQGDDDRGTAYLMEALAVARELGADERVALVLCYLGIIAEDTGRYAEAEARLGEAVAVARQSGDGYALALALAHLGVVGYGRGDLAAATARLEAAAATARTGGYWLPAFVAELYLAHVTTERGDHRLAANRYREVLVIVGPKHGGLLDGGRDADTLSRIAGGVAALAAAAGQPERALRLFAAAAGQRQTVNLALALPERATYERAIATAQHRLGAPVASGVWTTGHALLPEAVLAEIVAAIDLLSGEPPGESRYGLTVRETEVLRWITVGRSNQQIAEALSISHRTVTTHVGHILAKLGVDNRAEAAVLAVRDGLV